MTVTSFPDAKNYVKAMEILVKRGDSLEDLSSANHYALAQGLISLKEFQAAARVLAEEFLRRS